jgi:hypothetical protein
MSKTVPMLRQPAAEAWKVGADGTAIIGVSHDY